MPNSDIRADDLVFVYGALRSGTTVFRLMLDAHPQIANPGEMDSSSAKRSCASLGGPRVTAR